MAMMATREYLPRALSRGVKRLHVRAMPDGRDRRLIQTHTHLAASTADVSLALVIATIVVERGQAYESRDGLTTDLPNSGR